MINHSIKKSSRNKIIISIILLILIAISLSKIILNKQLVDAYSELSDKSITSILVKKSSVYLSDEYTISDKGDIKVIIDYIIDTDKKYTPLTETTVYSGIDYYLSFADNKTPPHYTHINLLGNQLMDLRLYNYADERYYTYRAKIDLTEDEINHILSEHN